MFYFLFLVFDKALTILNYLKNDRMNVCPRDLK